MDSVAVGVIGFTVDGNSTSSIIFYWDRFIYDYAIAKLTLIIIPPSPQTAVGFDSHRSTLVLL